MISQHLRGESENFGEGEISLPNSSEINGSSAMEMSEKRQYIQMICLDKMKGADWSKY